MGASPRTEVHTSVKILADIHQQLRTPENGCPEAVLCCAPLWSLTVKQMGSKEASGMVVLTPWQSDTFKSDSPDIKLRDDISICP